MALGADRLCKYSGALPVVKLKKELSNLETLSLGGTKVTDQGLAHLKELTKLQRLTLSDTKVTDAGLEHLV